MHECTVMLCGFVGYCCEGSLAIECRSTDGVRYIAKCTRVNVSFSLVHCRCCVILRHDRFAHPSCFWCPDGVYRYRDIKILFYYYVIAPRTPHIFEIWCTVPKLWFQLFQLLWPCPLAQKKISRIDSIYHQTINHGRNTFYASLLALGPCPGKDADPSTRRQSAKTDEYCQRAFPRNSKACRSQDLARTNGVYESKTLTRKSRVESGFEKWRKGMWIPHTTLQI